MLVEFCGFEWDSIKNEANKKKHGISFENAIRVSNDPCLLEKYDALHSSHDEERYASELWHGCSEKQRNNDNIKSIDFAVIDDDAYIIFKTSKKK